MKKYIISRTEFVHIDGSKVFSKMPIVVSNIEDYRDKLKKEDKTIKEVNFVYELQDS